MNDHREYKCVKNNCDKLDHAHPKKTCGAFRGYQLKMEQVLISMQNKNTHKIVTLSQGLINVQKKHPKKECYKNSF